MKRKLLSLLLALTMTVSLLTVGASAVEPTYGDIAGHWAEASIERWSGHGIIQGNNGKFNPNGQLTCAHFAAILARLLKLPAAKDAGFSDNTPDAWHYDAINRCAAAGILKGNLNGTVTPNAPITRERAMVMLGRALGIEPIENPDLTQFTDGAQVASYAQGMLAALIRAGIVGGVTADQLAPQNNITRAATVTILDRSIGTYADKAGETVAADGKGIVLVVADDVTITGSVDKLLVPTNDIEVTIKGSKNIDDIMVSGDNSTVILDNASADNVTLDGEKSAVETKNGAKIDNVIMTENAPGANVNAGNGTTIKNVENHAEDTSITGSGTVKKVESDKDITVKTKETDVKNIGDEKITVTDKSGKDTTIGTTGSGSSTTVNKGTTSSGGGGGSSSGSHSHSHSYATAWSYDDTYHWHASTCGHDVVSGKANHSFIDGVCSVCGQIDPTTAVAKIGSKNYKTLAEAINAADAGDTVTLVENSSENFVVPSGKDITLDLNGYEITTSKQPKIEEGGSLTIRGEGGSIILEKDGIYLEGSLTLESGKIESKKPSDVIFIMGNGNFTMTGGMLLADAGACIDASYLTNGVSRLNITGGVVETKDPAVNAIYINNRWGSGKIELTISGGTIKAAKQAAIALDASDSVSTISLTGGTFSSDPSEYVAAGYVAKPSDGAYTVVESNFYADTEGVYHIRNAAGLREFGASVNNETSYDGKTILLDDDIDLSGENWTSIDASKYQLKNATINGQNHTIRNMTVCGYTVVSSNRLYGFGFIGNLKGAITIKNVAFDNASVRATEAEFNGNIGSIVLGYTHDETLFENVTVTNSTVSGYGKIGILLGMGSTPGVKVSFKNCVSKDNTINGCYDLGGLAGMIMRGNGQDNTSVQACTVENITVNFDPAGTFENLENVAVNFMDNDEASGTVISKTVSGKYAVIDGYYWVTYGDYYVSYGKSSYDAPITTEGYDKAIANSEWAVNKT